MRTMNIKIEVGRHEFKSMMDKLKVKDESRFKQFLIDTTRKRLELRTHDSVEIVVMEV